MNALCIAVHMQERNSIFNYSDYKVFLRNYAQLAKSKNPSWSFGAWAQRLNLASTSAITMIVNGDRHPSLDVGQRLCSYFKFNEKEKSFFLDLVRLQKVKNDPELSYLILKNLTSNHPLRKFTTLKAETFDAISSWAHYAVREMTTLPDFSNDPDWIKERLCFPVGKKQIEKAILDLAANGLISKDKNNVWRSTNHQITTTDDVAQEAIVQYHEQVAELAKLAVRQFDTVEREFGALTLNIKPKDMKKIKEFIRKFQDEFLKNFESSAGEETYQLELGFFPLTRKEKKNEAKITND